MNVAKQLDRSVDIFRIRRKLSENGRQLGVETSRGVPYTEEDVGEYPFSRRKEAFGTDGHVDGLATGREELVLFDIRGYVGMHQHTE